MADRKSMPTEADENMISAAYLLLESEPANTPERQRRLVAKIWRTMASVAPGPRASGLTPRMRRIHEIIFDYINDNGMAPTYEEIGKQAGLVKADVHYVVHALKRRGVLYVKSRTPRSIKILVSPGEPIPSRKS